MRPPPPEACKETISHTTAMCGWESPLTLGGTQFRFPESCTSIKIATNSIEGICKGGGLERMESLKGHLIWVLGGGGGSSQGIGKTTC